MLFRSVNSARVQGIEHGNRLVLQFASDLLSSKLEKAESRQIVEQALEAVLGKQCRVRATTRTSPDPEPEASPPASKAPAGAETFTEAESSTAAETSAAADDDPVVRDLVNRGGRVIDVQVLSDE